MPQDIAISAPNHQWVQAQIDNGAFADPSAVINDLIRRARANEADEVEMVRRRLIAAEQGGFTDKTGAELLESFHEQARRDGRL